MSKDSKPTVLVTGAGGFLGGRVVEMLHLSGEAKVRAGVHRWSNAVRIGRFPLDIYKLDLLKSSTLRNAIEGVDMVVNCAHGGKKVNEKGTENLLKTCIKGDVKQVVHISTIEVYNNKENNVAEGSNLEYSGDEYGDSKLKAEKNCRKYIGKGLPITILRPTIIYGPFSHDWSRNIAVKLKNGTLGRDSRFDGYVRPVYVDDVVNAISLSLDNDMAFGEAFNIGGKEKVTWSQFFETFANHLGVNPDGSYFLTSLYASGVYPLRLVGGKAMEDYEAEVRELTASSNILKTAARSARDLIEKTPSIQELQLFKRKQDYSIDKARRVLGFDPAVDLSMGLEMASKWLEKYWGFSGH